MKVTLEIDENELKKIILILQEVKSSQANTSSLSIINNFRVAKKLSDKLLRKMGWEVVKTSRNTKTIKSYEKKT